MMLIRQSAPALTAAEAGPFMEAVSKVFEVTGEAIAWQDRERRILQANAAFAALAPQPAIDRDAICADCHACPVELALANARPVTRTVTQASGRRVDATAFPVQGDDGAVVGAIVLERDVTDAVLATGALDRLLEADATAQRIIAVRHQVNNDLAAIQFTTQVLAQDAVDPQVQAQLTKLSETAVACSDRLGNLPDRTTAWRPLDLAEIVARAVAVAMPLWHAWQREPAQPRDLQLQLSSVPLMLGDAAALRAAIISLLLSSLEASPDADCFVVRVVPVAGAPMLAIDAESASNRHPYPRRLPAKAEDCLRRHVGTITRADQLHPDRCVAVSFPATAIAPTREVPAWTPRALERVLAADDARAANDAMATGGAVAVDDPRPSLEGPAPIRALVVEDQASVAEFLAKKLTKEGFDTEVVYDGATALERLTASEFTALFIDFHLPDMDGATLARTAAAQQPVSCWLMSGDLLDNDLLREDGIVGILQKPIKNDDWDDVVAWLNEFQTSR